MTAALWHCWPVKAAGTAAKKAAGALAWGRGARHVHRGRHVRRARRVGKAAGAATARTTARKAVTWVCVATGIAGGGLGGGMWAGGWFGPVPVERRAEAVLPPAGAGFAGGGALAALPPEFTAPQQFAALIPPLTVSQPTMPAPLTQATQATQAPRPVPEPGSLALLLPALAALIAWRLK